MAATGVSTAASTTAIGTGPFKLESFKPDAGTNMVVNPDWWDKPEHNITRIEFKPIKSDATRVAALQARLADELGFAAGLFVPSGTQSNLLALMAHCERGDEYIVGQLAHTYRYEGGGAAVFGSVQPQPLTQDAQGRLQLADIAAAIKPDDPHYARTRLLCLENTWNGHVMSDEYLLGATALARERGLNTHLDGARVFNAAVASAASGQTTLRPPQRSP